MKRAPPVSGSTGMLREISNYRYCYRTLIIVHAPAVPRGEPVFHDHQE